MVTNDEGWEIMCKKTLAVLLCALFMILLLTACDEDKNSEVVGKWIPSTASIGGTTLQYSSLGIDEDQFGLTFEANGNCTMVTTGIKKTGTFVFSGTSIDVKIKGETKKLDYNSGTITLSLNYDNNPMQIVFIRAREED